MKGGPPDSGMLRLSLPPRPLQDYLAQKGMDVPMEVETRSLEEVRELMHLVDGGKAAKVTRIMLDNMAQLNPACPGVHSSFSPSIW